MTKKHFSLDQHRTAGEKLYTSRRVLSSLCVELGQSYPKNSGVQRKAMRAARALDDLRCELDKQAFVDYPALGDSDMVMRLYYGHGHR